MHGQVSRFFKQFHSPIVIGLSLALTRRADQLLLSRHDISFAQFKIMAMLLEHGTLSQQKIAKCLGLTAAAVSRMTQALVEKKCIIRHHTPDNRRQNNLALSRTGKTATQSAVATLQTFETTIYSALTASEIATFKELAERVLESAHSTNTPQK